MIKEIINRVEESQDEWRKAAFYSDEAVTQLLEELYKRWEGSGMAGIPLDYATDEELSILYDKAMSVSSEKGFSTFKNFVRKAISPGK
ncbi:MAG: hypothetical protein J7L55_01205 [Desulfurococcales archaeon]|nr:hypothetical protein [Desulfurococcales archaeon]